MSHFFRNFLRDYQIGALTASSQGAVNKISSEIDFSKDMTIVEYGPGDGAFTKHFLERMSPKSRLIVIETNMDFVSQLKQLEDERLNVLSEDIKKIELKKITADYVVSGIPFTMFSEDERRNVVGKTSDALKEDGVFLIYQYSPLMKRYLMERFKKVQLKMTVKNFPPYFIMRATK